MPTSGIIIFFGLYVLKIFWCSPLRSWLHGFIQFINWVTATIVVKVNVHAGWYKQLEVEYTNKNTYSLVKVYLPLIY